MAVIFWNTPLRGSSMISRAFWCLIKRQCRKRRLQLHLRITLSWFGSWRKGVFYWTVRRLGRVAQGDCGSLCWSRGEGSLPMFLLVRINQGHCSFLTGEGPEGLPMGWDGHWLRNFREGWSIFNINSFSSTFLLKIYEVLLTVDIIIKITDNL